MEIFSSFLSVAFIPGISFTFCRTIRYRCIVQPGRRGMADIQLLSMKTGETISAYRLAKAPAGSRYDDEKGL